MNWRLFLLVCVFVLIEFVVMISILKNHTQQTGRDQIWGVTKLVEVPGTQGREFHLRLVLMNPERDSVKPAKRGTRKGAE